MEIQLHTFLPLALDGSDSFMFQLLHPWEKSSQCSLYTNTVLWHVRMSTHAWVRTHAHAHTHEYAAKTEMKVCTQYLTNPFFRDPLVEQSKYALSRVHISLALGYQSNQIFYHGTKDFWVLSVKSVSSHHSGTSNFEMAPRFLDNLCPPRLGHCLHF